MDNPVSLALKAVGAICVLSFFVGIMMEASRVGRPFTAERPNSYDRTLMGKMEFLFALVSIFGLGYCMYLGAERILFFWDAGGYKSTEFAIKQTATCLLTGFSTVSVMEIISRSGRCK